jgi:hypothetical protein
MNRPFLLILIATAIAHTPALAESDFQQWLTVSAKGDIGDSVTVQGESIARFSNASDGLYEIENVLMLGYKLDDHITAWAGYVHNPAYDGGDFVITEHRARQQITFDNFAKVGSASLSARVRLEQRWREGLDGTAWRIRPYLKASLPFGANTAPVLNFSAEPFFNLATTSFQNNDGLDRLRSAVSVTFPIASDVRLETGYLNQHRFVRNGEDRDDHALTASIAFSF